MKFSLRVQKLAFTLGTCGCLAGTVAAVVWGLREPAISIASDAMNARGSRQESNAPVDQNKEPGREDFAKLWDLPLRRPLYDPPPPKPEVRRPPPLQVELLGTIIEAENSMAIVRSTQGGVEYKRVGQTVGPPDSPASIVEIRGDAVVLERSDERITLEAGGQEQRR